MAFRDIKRHIPDQQKHQEAEQEDTKTGEHSISGSNPDPETDDNTLDAAHGAGLYENQDEEHPGEINIAREVNKDEREHQEKD